MTDNTQRNSKNKRFTSIATISFPIEHNRSNGSDLDETDFWITLANFLSDNVPTLPEATLANLTNTRENTNDK